MELGIVSDTHDNLELVQAAVDLFDGQVDAVVHCGDVVAPFSATPFDAEFDFYAVRGNNDGEWNLQSVVESFGTYLGECATLEFDDTSIAVYHGTSETLVDALVDCGDYDYVLRGHTHQRVHEERDGTVHLNPGGLPLSGDDGPFTVATLDTRTGEVEFHPLD
ncbi:MAG: metallophosphoesterase [Halobacteriota archaeon]